MPEGVRRRPSLVESAAGLLLYLGLLVWRAPVIVLEGRFWAEEAFFFQYARHADTLDALLAAPLGYLNLPASLAAWLANQVPLELAPRVTVLSALLVQILPAALLLWGLVPGLRRWWQRWLAVALLLVLPPSQEVWLNSVNAQFYLAISAALVLVAPAGQGAGAIVRRGLLLGIGLGGLPALFLTPLFWWRAYAEGSRERLGQALVLSLCGLLQASLVMQVVATGVRAGEVYWTAFPLVVLAKQVALPLLGSAATDRLASVLVPELTAPGQDWLAALLWSLVAGLWLLGLWAAWRIDSLPARYLLLASIAMVALGFWGGADLNRPAVALGHASATYAGRYYYAPNVLLALALLSLCGASRGFWQRGALLAVLGWMVVLGGLDFIHSASRYRVFFSGPGWSAEVTRWRERGGHTLAIWPESWYVRVAGTSAAGSPP